ncbi:MAG TPA: glycosyltransferase [Beijerinckiaceae bacterium]
MRYLFYTHSLVSDWNHGNAHFLRGVMRELIARGHEAKALEPADGWSRRNLLAERGEPALAQFPRDFPMLRSETYDSAFDHEAAASEADVVIVHEWTDPELVARLGRARRRGRFTLLFHDTHHRAVSAEGDIAGLSLEDYDAVLAFGETLRERYLAAGWGRRVFTWHEAADAALFRPLPLIPRADSLVWIGNWGDGERTQELETYLIEPVTKLGLEGEIYGVRYPEFAQEALAQAGLRYRGWLPNAEAPARFARHAVTVHVPRRPYVESLPGIPTIRMFEALACGIPLVSAPWSDSEGLFRPGVDFLMARDGAEMTKMLFDVVWDRARAQEMAKKGLETIRARHTCAHRVDELEAALQSIGVAAARKGAA